jgi:DNA-binding response OmpR family regulator
MASIKARILLIEGKRSDHPSFSGGLTKKGFQVEGVFSGNAAVVRLKENTPDMVLVDAASMQTSGRRICQSVREHAAGVPIVLIMGQNAENPDKTGADVTLVWPFTLQKLLNRIKPFLPSEPKDLLQVGPLKLDTEQRWVRCNGKQARLTPRLVILLKTLMEKPGEVVERNNLFRMVWDTAYTADTRTLDVHVSWLREALEDDPRHPRFIKTVRGVGNRQDVDKDTDTKPLPT